MTGRLKAESMNALDPLGWIPWKRSIRPGLTGRQGRGLAVGETAGWDFSVGPKPEDGEFPVGGEAAELLDAELAGRIHRQRRTRARFRRPG